VEDGHLVGKTGGKPIDGLGREGDLRYKKDTALPLGDTFSQSSNINLRLATPGNAMKEKY
jgi:hypothetical protein